MVNTPSNVHFSWTKIEYQNNLNPIALNLKTYIVAHDNTNNNFSSEPEKMNFKIRTWTTMTIPNVQFKVATAVLVMENLDRPHFLGALKFHSIHLLLIVDIADGHHDTVLFPVLSSIAIKVPPLFLGKPVVQELKTFDQTSWVDAITSWCPFWLHYSLELSLVFMF